MDEWRKIYEDNYRLIFWLIVAVLLFYTLRRHYLMDDAFISFRYAKNLIDGHGLVWNIGERVEGYSNFSWTMLIVGFMWMGVSPETSTYLMGLVLHITCLLLTYQLALKVLKNRNWSLLVMILTGTSYSVSGLATSGLETPLQLLLFLLTGYVYASGLKDGWTNRRILFLSLILNFALLTRPDSIVLVVAAAVGLLLSQKVWNLRSLGRFVVPFLLVSLTFLLWKQSYYGSILPNSYYAKVRGASGLWYGLFYVYLFSVTYLYMPFILMSVWKVKSLWKDNPIAGHLALFCGLWLSYIVYVGGDFMDFRFLVAIWSFLMIVFIEVNRRYVTDPKLRVALVVLLLLGTPNYFFGFKRVIAGFGVEKVNELADHVNRPPLHWDKIGKRMKEMFGGTDVVLGVGPAGAIPYYSELACIDLIGLTDPEIPKIAEEFSVVPGHRIITPMEYLYRRNVNLVVQPVTQMIENRHFAAWARNASWADIYRFYLDVDNAGEGRFINEATLLGIPINDDYIMVAWYLNPHEEVDRAIGRYDMKRIRISRR